MILDIPPELAVYTGNDIPNLHLNGSVSIQVPDEAGNPVAVWTYDGNAETLVFDPTAQTIEVDDGIPAEQLVVLQAALSRPQLDADKRAARQAIIDLAQSAVGVDIRDLTAAQIKALLALVLWDKKAIGNDLTIQPLGDWVQRRV